MAVRDLIVPTGLVHEKLGITTPPTVPVPTRRGPIDIRRLNILDETPAKGSWIDRDATIAFLQARSEESGGVYERLIGELVEVTL